MFRASWRESKLLYCSSPAISQLSQKHSIIGCCSSHQEAYGADRQSLRVLERNCINSVERRWTTFSLASLALSWMGESLAWRVVPPVAHTSYVCASFAGLEGVWFLCFARGANESWILHER